MSRPPTCSCSALCRARWQSRRTDQCRAVERFQSFQVEGEETICLRQLAAGGDHDRGIGSPAVGPHRLNSAHDVHAPNDGAKDDVLDVEPARLGGAQEKLHADARGKGKLASVHSGRRWSKIEVRDSRHDTYLASVGVGASVCHAGSEGCRRRRISH